MYFQFWSFVEVYANVLENSDVSSVQRIFNPVSLH